MARSLHRAAFSLGEHTYGSHIFATYNPHTIIKPTVWESLSIVTHNTTERESVT